MRVQVVGAGAIGSLFGYFLINAGVDVVFVARGDRLEQLKSGLKISGIAEFFEEVEVYKEPVKSWLSLVCVKSYDTVQVAKKLKGLTDVAMTVQNGIGNEDVIAENVPKVIGGITSYAAYVRGDTVVYAGEGETLIGNWKDCSDEVKEVEKMLRKGGMNVRVVENVRELKWKKAAINAVINPLTAILKVKNGELLGVWNSAKIVCEECKLVLEKLGIEMDVEGEVRKIVHSTAENKSSMLQDVEKGKRTEIDAITGKIVEVGKKLGVDVKVNELLYWLVKFMEERKC